MSSRRHLDETKLASTTVAIDWRSSWTLARVPIRTWCASPIARRQPSSQSQPPLRTELVSPDLPALRPAHLPRATRSGSFCGSSLSGQRSRIRRWPTVALARPLGWLGSSIASRSRMPSLHPCADQREAQPQRSQYDSEYGQPLRHGLSLSRCLGRVNALHSHIETLPVMELD
jgi:hypothetical protein